MTSPAGTLAAKKPSKALHLSLWGAQLLLGLAFAAAGTMKATKPIDVLAENMEWARDLPMLVRFIGVSELLGAIGVIVPAVTRIKPGLTALAGAGLATIMVLAAGFHFVRGEVGVVPTNFVLGGLAVFVAWGRWKKAPIAQR